MDILFNIGIFLSVFLGVLLLTKKQKCLPDILLAIWMFIISIHLLNYFVYYQGFWDRYPHLIGITVPFPLLHGPMLYLYVFYSLRNYKSLRIKDYLHFLPAIGVYLYMFKFYFFYTAEEKTLVDKGLVNDFSVFSGILIIGFIVSGLSYTIQSYRKLLDYKKIIHEHFSNDERINLYWLQKSIIGLGVIFTVVTAIVLVTDGFGFRLGFNEDLVFYALIIAFVFYIGFSGIQHENIFSNPSEISPKEPIDEKPEGEYKKSGLKPEAAKQIHEQLLKIMTDKKPFLNPKLTLANLAGLLQVSPNHLSQVINQYESVNFHDFVNRYRIDEFIERAKDNQQFSILAHAFDSGFNSKSSFNSIFKKQLGLAPSQYIAELKNSA